MIPKDPNDDKDVLVEIRAGTGGQEAALFAGEIFEMYQRYAEAQRWKVDVLSSSPSDVGGFKEVVLEVRGKEGAYSKLKHESGVHRVQRIPVTESGGRIHTSTVTVAVLPEAEEVDVQIDPNDLEIQVYRSSGPGGQSVNTTEQSMILRQRCIVECADELALRSEEGKEAFVINVESERLGGRVKVGAIDENRQALIRVKMHGRNPFLCHSPGKTLVEDLSRERGRVRPQS